MVHAVRWGAVRATEAWFRGGLVFEDHRLVYHTTLGLRVIKNKRRPGVGFWGSGFEGSDQGSGVWGLGVLVSVLGCFAEWDVSGFGFRVWRYRSFSATPRIWSFWAFAREKAFAAITPITCLGVVDSGLAGSTDLDWEGCRESRRCSMDTYPESYITKYTSIRRLRFSCSGSGGWELGLAAITPITC